VTSGSSGGGGDAAVDAGQDAGDDVPGEGGDGAFDAGPCTAVSVPALPQRGGPACPNDASTCFPGDMTGFIPRWVPPVPGMPHLGACTAKQISDALAQCLGSTSNATGCSTWKSQNPACSACVMTASNASQFGAVIVFGVELLVNLGACVALAEPCNEACGEAVQADRLCSVTACDPNQGPCAVTGAASAATYNACFSAADTTCGCTSFGTAATQCLGALASTPSAHPAATLCGLNVSDFDSRFTAVATFLCGP
jgi:hypothetical protein